MAIVTRTRAIQLVLAAWLLGLWLSRYGWKSPMPLLMTSLLMVILLVLLRKWQLVVGPFILLALGLGLNRGSVVFKSFQPLQHNYNQTVQVVGQIQDDPAVNAKAQTEMHLVKLYLINNDAETAVGGRLSVSGFAPTKLQRGDVVSVSGKLRPTLGNQQGQIYFANIELLAHDDRLAERLRQRFLAGTYTALPDPQASLGLGFLIGTRSLLPDGLLNQLTATGLTHIVAVSGYNLTILVRIMRRLLVRHSKFLATAGSVGLIVAFVAMTGFSPSIMRAAIVSGLALLAWYYGRHIKPLLLILLAASLTAGINPTYVWYDLGWYLSFLTFFGIMLVAPAILWRLFPRKPAPGFVQLICETSVAQIMALPVIMLVFKQVSVVAIPANFIILPFIPLAMLASLIAGLAGMLVPTIAGWFSWPASIVLSLVVKVVENLAGFKYAQVESGLSMNGLWLFYGAVVVFTFTIRRRMPTKLKQQYSVIT